MMTLEFLFRRHLFSLENSYSTTCQWNLICFQVILDVDVLAEAPASVFAPAVLRDDPNEAHPRASPVGKRDFILRCIE